MTQTPRYASLRDYLDVVRQRRVFVLLTTLLAVGGALAYSLSAEPEYEAEATLAFREPTENVELIGLPPVRSSTPEERAAVGAELANKYDTLEAARKRVKFPGSNNEFDKLVQARAEVRTNLVVVTAENSDPRRAAQIANAVAEETAGAELRDVRRRYGKLLETTRRELRALKGRDLAVLAERASLRRRLAQLETVRDFTRPVEVLESAGVPESPVGPRPVRNTLIALLAGLLLGIVLTFVREALDRRLRSSREIVDQSGLPLLGVVRDEALGHRGTADQLDLEAFRIMRTNLEYLDVDSPMQVVLVTSSLPEEGKSTVALALAQAAALSRKRVLLVGCDLRRPVIAQRLGVETEPGLTEFLAGRATPRDVVRAVTAPGLASMNGSGPVQAVMAVLPAGGQVPQPAELLRSQRFARFLAEVREVYDLIIIDSAPLLSVVDTLDLVQHVDSVILCVRSGQTTRDQLRAGQEALRRLPERPVGLVITGVPAHGDGDYAYYTYAYGYSATEKV